MDTLRNHHKNINADLGKSDDKEVYQKFFKAEI